RHQLRDHAVREVSIFGHSHGGGSTYDLTELLSQNVTMLPPFTVPYTAYVDAIGNLSDVYLSAETQRPPLSQFHTNLWQPTLTPVHGASIPGSEDNIDVNTQLGRSTSHTTIDDDQYVHSFIRARIETKVAR
ncbi:MAG: hypothetical protein K2Z80_16860, partial [Xanthobacteraceae bacterium]|nr:hypothetical protein [Xanthobacteraceae bacterium]